MILALAVPPLVMLAERERHLDCDDDGNRLPVSDSRREAPLLRRAARRLIEAILAIERSNHVDFANGAIGLGPFTRAETPPSRYFRLQTSDFKLQTSDFRLQTFVFTSRL